MKISLNPLFYCNFSCSFCYLTSAQLRDKTIIDFNVLAERLAEIPYIEAVDIYGGEVGLLTEQQWYDMKSTIRRFYDGPINVITNLSKIHKGFLDDDITLSVSYDFSARQGSKSVMNNMRMLPKPFSILMLASNDLLKLSIDEMIIDLNTLNHLESVEIKPYSTNQANSFDVTFKDFENFVIQWIESPVEKRFDFINDILIDEALSGEYSAFSDDHIYITPQGKFAVLEFDDNDNEYFLELSSFNEYEKWVLLERARVTANPYCSSCEYFGKCLSEHLRNVIDVSNSCNGFKGLLDYYKKS